MDKDIDKIILYSWPIVSVIQGFAACGIAISLIFLISWGNFDAIYDFNAHATEESVSNLIFFCVISFIFFVGIPLTIAALLVASISLFSYHHNTGPGYWYCFKNTYKKCVRVAWIIILPVTIFELIIFAITGI